MLKVMIGSHGPVVAFVLWGAVFLSDFVSTVSIKNYDRYETNPLYRISMRYVSKRTGFVLVGLGYLATQLAIFLIFDDLLLTYALIVGGVCVIISNTFLQGKNHFKCNSTVK